jgi:hypothetical protein
MTFSVVVAYGVFVLASLAFISIIVDVLIPRSEVEEYIRRLNRAKEGYSTKYDWRKIAVLFLVWFGTGMFLFG